MKNFCDTSLGMHCQFFLFLFVAPSCARVINHSSDLVFLKRRLWA